MKRKKVIRTTEATDRCLITAVHSALVVYARLCVYRKMQEGWKGKNKLVHFKGKGFMNDYKGVIGCYLWSQLSDISK